LMGAYPDFNGGAEGRQKVDQQNLCLARLPLARGRHTASNVAAETVDWLNKNGAIVGVEQARLRVKYRVQFVGVAVMDRVEIGFDCGQQACLDGHCQSPYQSDEQDLPVAD